MISKCERHACLPFEVFSILLPNEGDSCFKYLLGYCFGSHIQQCSRVLQCKNQESNLVFFKACTLPLEPHVWFLFIVPLMLHSVTSMRSLNKVPCGWIILNFINIFTEYLLYLNPLKLLETAMFVTVALFLST